MKSAIVLGGAGFLGSHICDSLIASDYRVTAIDNLSSGNSGGPLIDNEGNVVGVNTWSRIDEQYNIAVSLDAFCTKILECEFVNDGEKTWWDYS